MTISNYSPQTGKLPALLEGYTGYYLSLTGQLVFAFRFCEKKGRGYFPVHVRQAMDTALENLCAGVPRLFKKEPKL
jgi:hypothetical protein